MWGVAALAGLVSAALAYVTRQLPVVQPGQDRQRQHRARQGKEHVTLGAPDIALGAEKGVGRPDAGDQQDDQRQCRQRKGSISSRRRVFGDHPVQSPVSLAGIVRLPERYGP